MEYMPEFSVLKPSTPKEASQMLRDHQNARILAGGTDLLVNIRRGIETPETLIDISSTEDMRDVLQNPDGSFTIGAGVTLATLEKEKQLPTAIRNAAKKIAATSHRNIATVGGNLCLDTRCVYYNQSEWWRKANDYCLKSCGDICHVAPKSKVCFAAFSGDLAPALMVFAARVDIIGPDGIRTCALDDLYQDDGADHLRLNNDEMIVSVTLLAPNNTDDMRSGYVKARVRNAIEFPLAGVAVALKKVDQRLASLKIALTGVATKPVALSGTEALLGRTVDEDFLNKLTHLLPKQIQPMTSTFTPPGYRRKVANNLMCDLVKRLFDGTYPKL